MKIAVPKERRAREARVAASPETVKKLVGLGAAVTVEAGAGAAASMLDAAYEAAGAAIAADIAPALAEADAVLKVQRPSATEIAAIKQGAMLCCIMAPHADPDTVKAASARGLVVFGMEFIPRITRAQSMDVLSSQANLAGYRAVIEGAAHYTRSFPMFMTAAGTVQAAKCFVLGAGVAGLQAIATARRLGAVVSATDVRKAAGEQVESLGAKFVFIDLPEGEAAGGYARALTPEEQQKQAALVAQHIKAQDIVITTALVPGRPAPKLITQEMVETMKPGSVIVDLAAEAGGNCALTRADEVVRHANVAILGFTDLPSRIAVDASALYARNLFNFLQPLVDKETKSLKPNWDDEIVKGTLLAKDGNIVHPALAALAA
ncbi:MAG TPA: Re/Si-specific NAD(P)(+) transhydrogenase subunit alpha [Alphaproteobacteria bacterium]|jgi:NAD(P) transhydrogenase subunit alpha